MSRTAVRAVSLAAVASAAGLGVVVLVSPAPGLTAEIYLFVVAAVAVAAVLLGVASALPRREPATLQQPPRTQRVGQLESVARALDLAEASAFDLHNALRPIVREIAAARLIPAEREGATRIDADQLVAEDRRRAPCQFFQIEALGLRLGFRRCHCGNFIVQTPRGDAGLKEERV